MFLRQVLSGVLVVAECLNAHGLQTVMDCKLYHLSPETTKHVLFECLLRKLPGESLVCSSHRFIVVTNFKNS